MDAATRKKIINQFTDGSIAWNAETVDALCSGDPKITFAAAKYKPDFYNDLLYIWDLDESLFSRNKDFLADFSKEQKEKLADMAPYTIAFMGKEARDDKDLVLRGVRHMYFVPLIQCVSERLRDDKDVALAAVRNNGAMLQYVGTDLRNDPDVAMTAIKTSGYSAAPFVGKKLCTDQNFLLDLSNAGINVVDFLSCHCG